MRLVHQIAEFAVKHPGGEDVLRDYAGTKLFRLKLDLTWMFIRRGCDRCI